VPSRAGTPSQFSFSNRHAKSLNESLVGFDGDYLNTLPMTAGSGLSGFRIGSMPLTEDPASESFSFGRIKIPSLQEIRALNSVSTLSSASTFPNPNQEPGEQHTETSSSRHVLEELRAFSSTIFITQAEIAGISSAVAEYLSWLRNVPGLPKFPTDSAVLLQTLEARVRELQGMAEEKHWVAWKVLLEKLDGIVGVGSQSLGNFEAEMRKRTAEVARAFDASYDVGKAMHE